MNLKSKLTRQLNDLPQNREKATRPSSPQISEPQNQPLTPPAPPQKAAKRSILESLQKQLQNIAPTTLGYEQPPPSRRPLPPAAAAKVLFDPHNLPGATTEESSLGQVFFVENSFPLPYRHGNILLTKEPQALRELTAGLTEFTVYDLKNTVFFDLETTGLAGGTGTIPFMIGCGRIIGDNFIVRQYFAHTPAAETAMLAHFRHYVGQAPLVSFNGRTFDLPLIQSRLVLNRLPADMDQLPHLDLINLSRRFWKTRLHECNLKHLEETCMDIHRHDDIDGSEVPQIYLDYLKGRPAPLLERIFYHNKIDIVTLLALANTLVRQQISCANGQALPEDLYSYGRHLLKENRQEEALAAFNAALLKEQLSKQLLIALYNELGCTTKHLKGRSAAVCYWQRLLELDRHNFSAKMEICKYLEHELGDYQQALAEAQSCQDWSHLSFSEEDELRHRIGRLRGKLKITC